MAASWQFSGIVLNDILGKHFIWGWHCMVRKSGISFLQETANTQMGQDLIGRLDKPKTLGIKKALVFYAGKAPKGVKTNWIMHEYRLANVDRSAGKRTNLRLDDWVLCRIYNKKGVIEKDYNNDQKPKPTIPNSLPQYSDFEDQKPVISGAPIGFSVPSPLAPPKNDLLHFDTSDSVPRCHTDTSGSNLPASPEFMCDKEVQSDPKWNDFDKNIDFPSFNYMDAFTDDPFQHDQMTSFQDIYMLLR